MTKKACETKNSISYKHPEQNKSVRGNKLGGSYTKEGLLNEYNVRQIKSNEIRAERGTDRAKGDIGKSILFGGNEVSSGRDDKLVSIDKTEQRQTEPNNRPVEERKTDTRARADRNYTEIKQGGSSLENGNGGSKERQQSEDRGINQDNTENTRNNTGYIHEISRDTVRDKQIGESQDMERQGNSIRNTTRSDNRIDTDDSRSIPSDNPLDELVNKFDKTIKKVIK